MSQVRTNSITDAAGTGAPDFPNGVNAATALIVKVDETERMRIDSSGNVGIGTTSPAEELHVQAGAPTLRLQDIDDNAYTNMVHNAGGFRIDVDPTAAGANSFFRVDVDGSERMRITSSGSVGIGTTSPDFPLDVSSTGVGSTIVSRFYVTDNTVGLLRVANSTTGDGSTAPSFGSNGTDAVIHTNNTEKLRVTSGGVLQFNSGYGSVAPAYGCRAWVNFNGTGTVAIRGSGNVSSITDLGTGAYRVNFATGMPDANYAVATSGEGYTLGDAGALQGPSTYSLSTSSFSLACGSNTNTRGGDWPTVSAVVFR